MIIIYDDRIMIAYDDWDWDKGPGRDRDMGLGRDRDGTWTWDRDGTGTGPGHMGAGWDQDMGPGWTGTWDQDLCKQGTSESLGSASLDVHDLKHVGESLWFADRQKIIGIEKQIALKSFLTLNF